jgi:hypothetical protein
VERRVMKDESAELGAPGLPPAVDQAVEDPVQEPFELGAQLRGGRDRAAAYGEAS